MQVHSQVVWQRRGGGGGGGGGSLSAIQPVGGGEGAVKKGSILPGTGLSRGGGGPLQWAKYESTKSHKAPSGLMQRKLS